MINFLFYFLINFLDLGILYKYLHYFTSKRKYNCCVNRTLYITCVIILTTINLYDNPLFNLLFSFTIVYVYSSSFILTRFTRLLLPALFFGLGFVTEPLGLLLLRVFNGYIPNDINYKIAVVLCEIIRFILILGIVQSWRLQFDMLPINIVLLLFLIPVLSVAIGCIAIYISTIQENILGNILCIFIIFMLLLSNVLTFTIFQKFGNLMLKNHKNKLMLQEATAKEQYYKEVEKNNKNIQKIKHDLKNRLLGIAATPVSNQELDNEIKKIFEELEYSDKQIYTSNTIFNTVLSNKLYIANVKFIKTSVRVMIPSKLNIDYSDTGILLGNLLDNAIEACEKIEPKERSLSVIIIYKNHSLIIIICNSKENKPALLSKSSKPDYERHGFGIQSVKNVVEKYGGVIEFIDKGNQFEVSAVLYEMRADTKNEK